MQEKYKIFFSLLVEKLKHMNNMTSKIVFSKIWKSHWELSSMCNVLEMQQTEEPKWK